MSVFGTRPEAIKMAPVVLELQKHSAHIEPVVAVTAQHREMLDQVLDLFAIKPDYDLDIMAQGQTLFDITGRALNGLNTVLAEAKPDLVVLAGYLKILNKEVVNAFLGKIINIHPSLLPKYGGKGCYGLKVHEKVLESGDTVTGATIHYVTEGVDQGEIILQNHPSFL